MDLPEEISEALNQTQLTIKSFRKSMLVLLFEWQNLETRLEKTQKCINKNFPVQESDEIGPNLMNLGGFEQKERDFMVFQEKGYKEMELREEKLGVLRKEILLREKRVEEREGVVEMEKKVVEEKEKRVEECLREIEGKEKELVKREREIELKEKEFEGKEKLNPSKGSAFRIAGSSNQSMALVSASETSAANQQISKGRLRSKAWLHFTKIAKGLGSNDKCKCNYCHRIFTLCGGSTSQLLRHISEGRCEAYQKSNSTLQIDGMQQSVDVQVEEAFTRPFNVGEDSRTPLMKGSSESVKQEPSVNLLEQELQTQPHMEPQMTTPNNNTISEYDYQPRQLKDLSKSQSDPSFNQPPPGMGNSGSSRPFSRYSMSLENSDYIIRMEDSDRYSEQTPVRHNEENSDINENASGDNTSEDLQMFTCEVEKPCCSGDQVSQNRKREREDIIEQNENSNNVFLHPDEDLSSPLRKQCASKLSTHDGENTEDVVLHEADPISCAMPIDPAQELYGHMMDEKDLIDEGSMPE